MRVLIANKFEQSGRDGLAALGLECVYEPDVGDALGARLAEIGAEILIVRGTKVPAEALAPSLKLIVRAGSGLNTIDVAAATARGILVANCPGKNAIAVAELAFGLIIALDRQIPDGVADLRARTWDKKRYSEARGLYGRTLSLLGAGPIAAEMIRRASGFGMPVVIWSRRFDGADRAATAADLEALGLTGVALVVPVTLVPTAAEAAGHADVMSIHLAAAPETRNLINADVLGRLKPGAIVINTARGDVLDEDALRAAMRERGLRAGLDVFSVEPPASTGVFADTIVAEPGVYGTHHIGGSTDQAQEAVAAETVRIVKSFIDTGRVPNAVTE
jgi:D-3-phosphoglycerate dehydrogenase